MRALLIYPRFPQTFWSYERVLALVDRRAFFPPLGLLTVAALLPPQWQVRVVDRNVRPTSEADWAWADCVLLSAMIVQRNDMLEVIREANQRGIPIAVGGPYPTAVPAVAAAGGADYLVLDEGEITVPMFLEQVDSGRKLTRRQGDPLIIRAAGEKPDMAQSPLPRFDLIDFPAYDSMPVQFSRGCPFLCEFCDIIELYGRRPRTKGTAQLLAELDCLYRLGWRRGIFLVDDNFIGNKRRVKELLRQLRDWQAHHGYPFQLGTEASIDLAADAELLELMAECNFDSVFIGIETPDRASLTLTRKHQNNRQPMTDAVRTVAAAGLRVQAGFIIGFDGEEAGAGERIARFVEDTAIPTAMLSMLQALPGTALWRRLERDQRLLDVTAMGTQTQLTNFVPTRPLDDLAREYVSTFRDLYDPLRYLDRTYRYFRVIGAPRCAPLVKGVAKPTDLAGVLGILVEAWRNVRALAVVCWRQGVRRKTRGMFWHHLFGIAIRNRRVLVQYLVVCAHNEHFLAYRDLVRDEIERQLVERQRDEGCPRCEESICAQAAAG